MRILLTGAGGPSAVSVWKSLHPAPLRHTLYMADMDACASGLYLVPEQQRLLVPRGDDPAFVEHVLRFCQAHAIDLLISTVDAELAPLAQALGRFEAAAVKVPLSPLATLQLCRDKLALLERVKDLVPTPAYEVIDAATASRKHTFPLFAKPRISAGSRHATLVADQAALQALPRDSSFLLQQWLPGDEYSVDVYLRADGQAVAAVPRWRMKTDSGIAMAAQTVHDAELQQMAVQVCQAIGIRHVANVQFKRDRHGQARLLEINPRFPGTLPLTTQAGVDMPALMVAEMLGQPLPPGLMPFQELMAVRYLTEQFVSTAQWQQLNGSR